MEPSAIFQTKQWAEKGSRAEGKLIETKANPHPCPIRHQIEHCSRCPEVLQPVERALDVPAQPVEALGEAESPLPVATVGNDWYGAALFQFLAQFFAVVGLVTKHPFGGFGSVDEPFGDQAIVRLTTRQQDGDQAPFSICECMDLRVAPAREQPTACFCSPLMNGPPLPPDLLPLKGGDSDQRRPSIDIAVLGIDLGKNSCSVVGLDGSGKVILRRRM